MKMNNEDKQHLVFVCFVIAFCKIVGPSVIVKWQCTVRYYLMCILHYSLKVVRYDVSNENQRNSITKNWSFCFWQSSPVNRCNKENRHHKLRKEGHGMTSYSGGRFWSLFVVIHFLLTLVCQYFPYSIPYYLAIHFIFFAHRVQECSYRIQICKLWTTE